MVKIPSPRRLFRSRSKSIAGAGVVGADICAMVAEHEKIEWEVRPGGMLVQKRRAPEEEDGSMSSGADTILVRVSTGWQWHDVSIDSTATFGDLKVMLSLVTGLWPRDQRLLYKGKERDDGDHLHMVGVQDKDKVLLLEDPAVKARKLRSTTLAQLMGVPCHSFIEV
ncbi:BAG family molecular chaperone regulator 2-like [Oryza brachyantha]|uniref:Ubiquitin-like domain-containing protein n=1 Tax=Oryza brachyantha TaxID=4533 RepID=J3L6X4_ORYBR|nr:BAG family molecular chaperone regulator 2-like [Oryza brachyantha]